MDLTQYQIKFGPNTKWEPSHKCSWCSRPLQNQNEKNYIEKGNCCSACNTKYAQIAFTQHTEREVTATERLIRQTRLEMDLLSLSLDKPISEEERQRVVNQMELKYIKIKMLKGE